MDSSEFEGRRQAFMRQMQPHSIAVIPTAPVCTRNRDVTYPFRPHGNFYYLTGLLSRSRSQYWHHNVNKANMCCLP